MSLDKAILHKREWRKQYRGSKAIDHTCRNHGTCEFCKGNRLYRDNREKEKLDYAIKETEGGDGDEVHTT